MKGWNWYGKVAPEDSCSTNCINLSTEYSIQVINKCRQAVSIASGQGVEEKDGMYYRHHQWPGAVFLQIQ